MRLYHCKDFNMINVVDTLLLWSELKRIIGCFNDNQSGIEYFQMRKAEAGIWEVYDSTQRTDEHM